METWGKWCDIHDELDQKKRLSSAKSAKLTPLELGLTDHSGVFSGSKRNYNTTLEQCECIDFSRRKKPCKHMYRLAIELGLIESAVISDIRETRSYSEQHSLHSGDAIIALLSANTDNDTQYILYDFLHSYLYAEDRKKNKAFAYSHNLQQLIDLRIFDVAKDDAAFLSYYKRNELNAKLSGIGVTGFKKNMKRERLIQWCIDNVSDITPFADGLCVVTLSPMIGKGLKKVYSWLKKEFAPPDMYFDPATGAFIESKEEDVIVTVDLGEALLGAIRNHIKKTGELKHD